MTLTCYRRGGDQEEYQDIRGHEEDDVDNYEDCTMYQRIQIHPMCRQTKHRPFLVVVVVGISKRLNRARHRFVVMAVISIVQSFIIDLTDYQL